MTNGELDLKIAQEVMGWECAGGWTPSTDVRLAMEVAEVMHGEHDHAMTLGCGGLGYDGSGVFGWDCEFRSRLSLVAYDHSYSVEKTAARAICVAALLAMGAP